MTCTPRQLIGAPCFGGLDLAKTRDTTAFVLLFDFGDDLFLLPRFWLPEETALQTVGKVPYQLWAEEKLITLTEGNVCDYAIVERDILELHELYNIRDLGFDRTYAEELTQRLETAGIPRTEVPQTMGHLAGPTAELERLILKQIIHHDGHAVFSWQMGNARVKTDANGNKRLKKPSPDDVRKIDGPAALVNAVRCWMNWIGNRDLEQPGDFFNVAREVIGQ
jgi:phage terminase large subunit-like protein